MIPPEGRDASLHPSLFNHRVMFKSLLLMAGLFLATTSLQAQVIEDYVFLNSPSNSESVAASALPSWVAPVASGTQVTVMLPDNSKVSTSGSQMTELLLALGSGSYLYAYYAEGKVTLAEVIVL